MWKIYITVSDSEEILLSLKRYLNLLPSSETEERKRVSLVIAKLEDLIIEVKEENKIVEIYLNDIEKNKLEKEMKLKCL